jgi:hypothetical protein
MSISSIGGPLPAIAPAESGKTAKTDDSAQKAAEKAQAEAKAAAERESTKSKPKARANDDVPKGFKPEVASANLANLLHSTLTTFV